MRPDQRKEAGLVVLYSLVMILIPLIVYGFYPESFPFSVSAKRIYVVFLLEFVWYNIMLLFMLRLASAPLVLFGAFVCLLYRLSIGVTFGLISGISGNASLISNINNGIGFYTPALLLQVILTPFILRKMFSKMVLRDMRKKKILYEAPKREMNLLAGKEQTDLSDVEQEIENKERETNLTSPLRYVKEYTGVEGVLLIDSEGLIVAKQTNADLNEEQLAPFMLGLEEANNRALERIDEKRASRIELYTPGRWINLTRIFNLVMVTVANRYTDELLNVRIAQAAEMIRKYMTKKYTQEVLSEVEGKNV